VKNAVFRDVTPRDSLRTDVSEELFLRSLRRLLVTASVVPSSLILLVLRIKSHGVYCLFVCLLHVTYSTACKDRHSCNTVCFNKLNLHERLFTSCFGPIGHHQMFNILSF
jgi:hypothetical protein